MTTGDLIAAVVFALLAIALLLVDTTGPLDLTPPPTTSP